MISEVVIVGLTPEALETPDIRDNSYWMAANIVLMASTAPLI